MPRCPEAFSRIRTWRVALLAGLVPAAAFAYNLSGKRWGGTTVTMQLQLGALNGTLLDGSTSWGAVAEDALATWNGVLTNLQFNVVRDSTAPIAQGNAFNNVLWSSTVYGTAWDSRTLGITLTRYSTATLRYSEADVLFNNTKNWNSYRGSLRVSGGQTLYDFRRVALHEFGHALGLDHPDDAGQSVNAVMNSQTSDTDNLTADDIAGARAIYDAAGSLASAPVLSGASSYSYQAPTLVLTLGQITNEGNLTSSALRAELWAMPQPYANGLPAGSQLLGAYALDPLAPGASYSNLNLITFYTPPPGGTYYTELLLTEFTGGSGSGFTIRDHIDFTGQSTFTSTALPAVTTQPAAQSPNAGGNVTFAVAGNGTPGYQWQRNGVALPGATSTSLAVTNVQPANTGVYQAVLTNSAGVTGSNFALLGLGTTSKVIGAGSEVASDIRFSNGNVFDQILLSGAAATFTADAAQNQITRLSFVDLTDDIVQVEFSGAGSVSIVLDNSSGPAVAANYNQPTVLYMKGHAGIVVTGANETTNLSVFSVGKANAVNQALFKDNVVYDGLADIAFIAIASSNGQFGGLRTANTVYSHSRGLVGVYAPGVTFQGPIFVGDIKAAQTATPMLSVGAASDVRVTGGDMLQTNARAVQVSGITQLKFAAGSTSHGGNLPAQNNKGRFEQNGTDVTSQIVVNPSP